MSRSLLAWCCAALTCFPHADLTVRSVTVSPVVFFTTTTAAADTQADYYGGGGGGGFSYGHRAIPPSGAAAKVRVSRDEPTHALYETPHTYQYMRDPRKGGRVRQHGQHMVPKTEKRPPGADVEYLEDARPGGPQRPAKERRRWHGDGDDDRYGHGGAYNRFAGGGRYDDYDAGVDRKRKRKRTTAAASGREPEVVSVDGGRVLRDNGNNGNNNKPHAKKNGTGSGGGGGVKKVHEREEVVDDLDAQVKHKIHKKNEFSKKQQFFDEEHVDHSGRKNKKNKKKKNKKKPTDRRNHREKGHKKRANEDGLTGGGKIRKRLVVTNDYDHNKDRGRFGGHTKPKTSQGYGHVLAVR